MMYRTLRLWRRTLSIVSIAATAALFSVAPLAHADQEMTATASGEENPGMSAIKAIDDNPNSRWSSNFSDDAWLTVDLGHAHSFDRMVLKWENAYGKAYKIQISDSNQDWATARTIYTQNAGVGKTEDFSFPRVSARYVRMQGVKRAAPLYGYSLFDLDLIDSGNTTPIAPVVPVAPIVTAPGTNLALGKVVFSTAPERDDLAASKAVDGNRNTRWSSAFGPEFTDEVENAAFITIDLGAEFNVSRVKLDWEAAYGKSYQILTSKTNTDWATAIPVFATATSDGAIDDISFPATMARYIRMQGVLRSSPYGYSLHEFEVYGSAITTQHAITASAGANGSITPNGTVLVTEHAHQSFNIVPAPGYAILKLVIDGEVFDRPQTQIHTFYEVHAAHSIQATFVAIEIPHTPVIPAGTNLALGKTATSTDIERGGLDASQAVDGKLDTRWASEFNSALKEVASISIDLGSPLSFNQVVLQWENAYGKKYTLEASNDGTNWTPILTNNAGIGGKETLSFPTQTARHVRMQGIERFTQYGYSLFEFEVYNTQVGALPVAFIDGPAQGSTYKAGDTLTFAARATDAEDGVLPASSLTWWPELRHNVHGHVIQPPKAYVADPAQRSLKISTVGETSDDVWLRFYVQATDSNGQVSTVVTRDIYPQKATVTLATVPPGLSVTLDGQPLSKPDNLGVVGMERNIGAIEQNFNGRRYRFGSWSDSGAASHTIFWPNANTTYTATFVDIGAAIYLKPTVVLDTVPSSAVGRPTKLSASTSDSDGNVVKVEYFDGGILIGSSTDANTNAGTSKPFAVTWTPNVEGMHRLSARATDNDGVTTDSVAVDV
ncbi:MAG: discoidin domain-containing protein, partial [Pseudomonadota bacterium]